MADFLFEVGLEEIPARMIAPAQQELARRVEDLLTRERLLDAAHSISSYSTPRRLAVLIGGVAQRQSDTEEQLTGPSWKVAFKDAAPPATIPSPKRRSRVSALIRVALPKRICRRHMRRTGRSAVEVLPSNCRGTHPAIYWAKNIIGVRQPGDSFARCAGWPCSMTRSFPSSLPGFVLPSSPSVTASCTARPR